MSSVIRTISPIWSLPSLADMSQQLSVQRVEVTFVGTPPTHRMERASGVSRVEVNGRVLRCVVAGSFQPFLEALRGHEVVNLTSTPVNQ